jgi:hypothetical protein
MIAAVSDCWAATLFCVRLSSLVQALPQDSRRLFVGAVGSKGRHRRLELAQQRMSAHRARRVLAPHGFDHVNELLGLELGSHLARSWATRRGS